MHLHQALDQRQPKPQAAFAAIQGSLGLRERLEQSSEHRGLDSNPVVADP